MCIRSIGDSAFGALLLGFSTANVKAFRMVEFFPSLRLVHAGTRALVTRT